MKKATKKSNFRKCVGVAFALVPAFLGPSVLADGNTGLTIVQAETEKLVATYVAPQAVLELRVHKSGEVIRSVLADEAGDTITHFEVPVLEGEDLNERYQEMVPELLERLVSTSEARKYQGEQAFGLVWTAVQMAEELSIQLNNSEVVPKDVRAALRLHPVLLGRAYEQPTVLGAPQPKIAIFSGSDGCFGACGPGCDWCVNLSPATSTYACYTNTFCELHDAYCGAWEDFFNCSFSNCAD